MPVKVFGIHGAGSFICFYLFVCLKMGSVYSRWLLYRAPLLRLYVLRCSSVFCYIGIVVTPGVVVVVVVVVV